MLIVKLDRPRSISNSLRSVPSGHASTSLFLASHFGVSSDEAIRAYNSLRFGGRSCEREYPPPGRKFSSIPTLTTRQAVGGWIELIDSVHL